METVLSAWHFENGPTGSQEISRELWQVAWLGDS
jgi:hypothetical protein